MCFSVIAIACICGIKRTNCAVILWLALKNAFKEFLLKEEFVKRGHYLQDDEVRSIGPRLQGRCNA